MKTIMILAAGNVVAGGIVGLIDVFSFTNALYRRLNPDATQDLFHCHIVSGDGKAITTNQGFQLAAMGLTDDSLLQTADAVVLASAFVTNKAEFNQYQQDFLPLLSPLRAYAQTGKPIAAYCSGTLMLATSGLLDNRRATTVWWLSQMFERNFARVKLCMDSLVVSDGQFHTAGATTSNLSLALHLVGLLAGESLAQQMAKILLIDPNRCSQQPFMTMAITPEQHQDELVRSIQQWMQANLNQNWLLDEVATKFAVGKRTLIRRFKRALNETPASYMQRLRVDEAKRLLETTELALEQIVARVGYEDVSSFRKLFIQLTSLSPRAYRQKFNTHTCC